MEEEAILGKRLGSGSSGTVQDDRPGQRPAGNVAYVEARMIGLDGPQTHQDTARTLAEPMGPAVGQGSGHCPLRRVLDSARMPGDSTFAVDCQLESHVGAGRSIAFEKRMVEFTGDLSKKISHDLETGVAKRRGTTARDGGVVIPRGENHAANSCVVNRDGAGGRTPLMIAGLQRDEERSAR